MKIANAKVVLNPYDWMPGHGESRVIIRTGDGQPLDIHVDVYFEIVLNGKRQENKKTILFECTYCHFFGVPYLDLTKFDHGEDTGSRASGRLLEFEYSEPAMALQSRWPRGTHIRHYEIYFLAANQLLTVFADGCRLL
jgi:hypothetical protein